MKRALGSAGLYVGYGYINTAKPILQELAERGRVARPYLGASLMDQEIANRYGFEINLHPRIIWCLGPESNRYGTKYHGILSPVRLPVPPPRQSSTFLR